MSGAENYYTADPVQPSAIYYERLAWQERVGALKRKLAAVEQKRERAGQAMEERAREIAELQAEIAVLGEESERLQEVRQVMPVLKARVGELVEEVTTLRAENEQLRESQQKRALEGEANYAQMLLNKQTKELFALRQLVAQERRGKRKAEAELARQSIANRDQARTLKALSADHNAALRREAALEQDRDALVADVRKHRVDQATLLQMLGTSI
jgi:regulator of replication initiation timing